jgi:release factor glutamine methyltransferase
MTVKIQTIKDIRNYLASELSELYSEIEIRSLTKQIISLLFEDNNLIYILKENEKMVDNKKAGVVIKYCSELKSGKPFQYITGQTLFYNCIIKVNPEVFIPRPETEELVDMIIKENTGFTGRIIDIGTGSGCIAIALARNLPSAFISGIDISELSLETAIKNAELNSVNVRFIRADIFKIDQSVAGQADIIVSNPPYVRNSEKKFMKKNVLDYEPHGALFVTDEDPLIFYRAILDNASYILTPGGKIYFEINEALGKQILTLMASHNLHKINIIKDLNGKDRIARGEKR